jgi:transposase
MARKLTRKEHELLKKSHTQGLVVFKQTVETLRLSMRSAYRWLERDISWDPKVIPGRPRQSDDKHVTQLVTWVEGHADATLEELAAANPSANGHLYSAQHLGRILSGLGFELKRLYVEPERRNESDIKELRRAYIAKYRQERRDHPDDQILYVDETAIWHWMGRARGRALRGERAVTRVFSGYLDRTTIIAAIGVGLGLVRYHTALESVGSAEMLDFFLDLGQQLAEEHPGKGYLVILDNAPVHRDVDFAAVTAAFPSPRFLRLPPYSPVFNPIEEVFGFWKARMKVWTRCNRARFTQIGSLPRGLRAEARRELVLEMAKTTSDMITVAEVDATVARTEARFTDALLGVDLQTTWLLPRLNPVLPRLIPVFF